MTPATTLFKINSVVIISTKYLDLDMDQVGSRILPIGQLSSDKFSLMIGSLNDQEKEQSHLFASRMMTD